MLQSVLSGVAAGAVILALLMIGHIVLRRDKMGDRRKLPTHILLVGFGTACWGILAGWLLIEYVSDDPPHSTASVVLALLGGLGNTAGLYKMIEILRVKEAPRRRASDHDDDGDGEPAALLALKERIAYVHTEMLVLFTLSFLGLVGGFAAFEQQAEELEKSDRAQIAQDRELQRLAREVVQAEREGCERINVLRENQATILVGDINENRAALADSLGALENFRGMIERDVERDRAALANLRRSALDFPVEGKPYRVDCVAAYP